ncbi:MAG: SDR family oxidoreductase [Candidatus Nanoarchaeia archaeon]
MEIEGKVVIVTGASQGIGLATARLLSSKGAKVVLAARSENILKKLQKEIPNSFAIKTDITSEEDIKNMVREAIERFGRIDILINNAGQGMHGFTVENTDINDYKKIMELNVFGLIRTMQAVIPQMKRQGGGMIVNISSMLSKMYIPNLAAYSSTKHAVNSISLTARQELAKDKIIVSIVLPKMTLSNFMKNSINAKMEWKPNSEVQMPKTDTPEKVAERILDAIKSEEAEVIV